MSGEVMLFVSDVHFGSNLEPTVEAFVKMAIDSTDNPDQVVVCPGDLTQDHSNEEYAKAERFLRGLLDTGIRVVLTPGNHDFGRWKGERFYVNESARKRFRGLLQPVLAQDCVLAHQDYDAITEFGNDIFVTLRSTHRGQKKMLGVWGGNRIRREQVEWAGRVLGAMSLEGKRIHLVTHRSLWQVDDDKHAHMRRRRRLEEELIVPFGFSTVVHGHNHVFRFEPRPTPKTGTVLTHLSVPTLSKRTSGPGQHCGWVNWRPGEGEAELIASPHR